MDEPTAALDPVAEYEVYSAFDQMVEGKTAIYISHRLSSCRFCDDIVVFDRGQLVQRGSHGELMADQEGLYHALYTAQSQYYENNAEKRPFKGRGGCRGRPDGGLGRKAEPVGMDCGESPSDKKEQTMSGQNT